MIKCEYEKFIIDYINNELSPTKHNEIEYHLSECDFCSNKLEELEVIQKALSVRERPEPKKELFEEYRFLGAD